MWPFEGREAELTVLNSAFENTGTGGVVIAGDAGLGKTRLARHLLSTLDDVRSAWVGATRAAASIPFGAVAPLLPDSESTGGPLDLIRAAAARISTWGGRHKVAIGVDDVHLLDDASSTLIAHLVSEGLAFAVMTVRSGRTMPDVLVRLCKDRHVEQLQLSALPEAVIDKLIDHASPGEVNTRQRQRLRQTAQGNPQALRELLHGAEPGGLTDLVNSRLDSLDPAIRYVVELVACGEPLSVYLIERLVGLPSLTLAEENGLVVVELSGGRMQARLGHPLYGEVIRSGLILSRARQVYRALAGTLLATPLRRREDHLLAALWQVEGGAVTRPDIVRAGAWQAVGHADLALAERLANAARTAEPGDEADRLLAEILAYRGRTLEAAQVLPSTPPSAPAERVAWAITRAEAHYWSTGDVDGAQTELDTAAEHQLAEASRSWLLFFDGRCLDAAYAAHKVLDDPDAEPKAVVWAAAAGCAGLGFLGRIDEAEAMYQRGAAVAAAHQAAMPWAVFEVDIGMCLAYLACGRPAAAQSIAMNGYEGTVNGGADMMVSGWALYAGLAALARGHVDRAGPLLAEALDGFTVNDTFRLARCCQAAQAAAGAMLGHPGSATMMAKADEMAHPTNKVFEPWIEIWHAWVAYAGRNVPAATQAATRAADLARDADMPAVQALACYESVRLGGRADLTRLEAIDSDLASLLARAARALTGTDAASELEAAARELQARGYDLHAAEAFTVAAKRHQRNNRIAKGSIANAHAAVLREESFPGANTLLLRHSNLISELTPRERQILLLAADHTSTQIAEELGLALPTVNNNLARAYTKLGITGRAQLRSLLGSLDDN